MSTSTRKHDDTKWNMFSMAGKALGKDPKHPNSLNHWVISDDNSIHLLPVDYALPTNIRKGQDLHYFLIDHDDFLGVKKVESKFPGFSWEKCADFFETLETFIVMLSVYGGVQKKFYIRVISSNVMGDEQSEDSRVFVDEVAMLIPLLRARQGKPFATPEDVHNRIFLRFNKVTQFSSTMTLNELEALLQEYDVDKSLLTLVDDPAHVIGFKSLVETGVPFKILSVYGTSIMSKEQATLYMFQHLICGIKWQGVAFEARIFIAETIHTMCLGQTGDYVLFEDTVQRVLHVKKSIFDIYKNRKSAVNMTYAGACLDDLVWFDEYKTVAETVDFPIYVFVNMDLPALPLWMHKLMLTLGLLHTFAQNEVHLNKIIADITDATVNGLMATVPKIDRKFIKEVQKEAVAFMLKPLAPGEESNDVLEILAQQVDPMSDLNRKVEQQEDKELVEGEKGEGGDNS